ncbi:PAS domain S-box protein [Leptolyngbya sp. AN02str]|uniref:PAS domain S-box protein n=1 Tax=Leptolyngbya sp. AN02str TaxID=3423363 RepID=UPI003D311864
MNNVALYGQVLGLKSQLHECCCALERSHREYSTIAQLLQGIVGHSTLGVVSVWLQENGSWVPSYVSPSGELIFGYRDVELLQGDAWRSHILEEDWLSVIEPALAAVFVDLLLQQQVTYRFLHPDGNVHWMLAQIEARWDEASYGWAVDLTNIDISQLMLTQQGLTQSEQQYRSLFEQNPNPMWVVEPVGLTILAANEAVTHLYGYSPEEMQGLNLLNLSPVGERSQLLDWFHHDSEFAEPPDLPGVSRVWLHCARDENQIYVDLAKRVIVWNGETAWLVLATNVTKRQQAEQALVSREAQLRALIDHLPFEVWAKDCEKRVTLQNTVERQLRGDMLGQLEDYDAIVPALRAQWDEQDRCVLNGTAIRIEEVRQVEGSYRCFDKMIAPIWVGNRIEGMVGVNIDITERKQAEAALQQSEERFREIANTLQQLFFVCSAITGEYYYVSPAYERLWGRSCQSLYDDPTSWMEPVHPDDLEQVMQLVQQQADKQDSHLEYRLVRPNGSICWISADITPIRDEHGQLLRYVGIAEDITMRKMAEEALQQLNAELEERVRDRTEALRQSEEQFRNIFDVSPVGIVLVHVGDRRIERSNEAFCHLLGYAEFNEQQLDALIYPADVPKLNEIFTQLQNIGTTHGQLELRGIRQTGDPVWMTLTATLLDRAQGSKNYAIAMVEDISNRKQAELVLRQQATREQLLRAIAERIRQSLDLDAIVEVAVTEVGQALNADRTLIVQLYPNGGGRVVREAAQPSYEGTEGLYFADLALSEACYTFYAQGNARLVADALQDPWGQDWIELMSAFQVRSKIVAPIVCHTSDDARSLWGLLIVHACREQRQWQMSEVSILQQIASQLAIAIQQSDLYHQLQAELAERNRIEAQLRASLQEKEVLLKEVHHRVKNNLQMISSLLSLQSRTLQSPAMLEPFVESQRRIQAIALIHQKLYSSENVADVNMADYIHNLATDLFGAFKAAQVRLQLSIEPVTVSIDVAIACGLIINELVSNAFKHAFTNQQAGTIQIQFQAQNLQTPLFTLSIQDNGIGLNTALDLSQVQTLGLRIVHAMVHKLRGTWTIDNTQGCSFTIAFSG